MGGTTSNLAPVPFRTPLVDGQRLLDGKTWLRWFTPLLQAVNQRMPAVTFAELPASPVVGMLIPITDSTTVTWGATISGSGTHTVLAHYNGTVWTVAAI